MSIATTQLSGATIAEFFGSGFVDTTAVTGEAVREKATLESFGHTVTTFTGTSASAFANALAGARVLVIPELEVSALALDPGAAFVIRHFVDQGGTLVINAAAAVAGVGKAESFLNSVFDTSILQGTLTTYGPLAKTAAASGTSFSDEVAKLYPISLTHELQIGSLPAGAKALYTNGALSCVSAFQYGKGQVIEVGWDFYNAKPTGSQVDGGWLGVLRSAISSTDGLTNGVTITGTKGNDKIDTTHALKGVTASTFDDIIDGKGGNDKLGGGAAHDLLIGGKGNDQLDGGTGDDVLAGGRGNDKMIGGDGKDEFVFDQTLSKAGVDKILDFLHGTDHILLDDARFGGLPIGVMSAGDFTAHISYDTGNGNLKFDGHTFAKLHPGQTIDHTDFTIF